MSKSKKEPPLRRPMMPFECAACWAIWPHVTYLPASFDKRFARDMAMQAGAEAPEITAKQAAHLWVHVWRYRRQLKRRPKLLAEAAKRTGKNDKSIVSADQKELAL